MPPKRVAIVDYGLGNLASVAGAVEKLGHLPVVTADPAALGEAERLILPGVGAFRDGMRNLTERGLVGVLDRLVLEERKPILGVCLGAQLICRESEEFGRHRGLGWIDARVVRLTSGEASLRVPHVGWNEVAQIRPSPLFEGIPDHALFYFVHSFRIADAPADSVIGTCEYGDCFPALLNRRNVFAAQFHPEKSQLHGLALLRNFIEAELQL